MVEIDRAGESPVDILHLLLPFEVCLNFGLQ